MYGIRPWEMGMLTRREARALDRDYEQNPTKGLI